MQLSKLRKNSLKLSKQRQKLKCLSLGIILPIPILTSQQLAQNMINEDSSVRARGDDVLLVEFADQLPQDVDPRYKRRINKLYSCFVKQINMLYHEEKQKEKEKDMSSKDHDLEVQDLRESYKPEHSLRRHSKTDTKKYIIIVSRCMVQIYEEADKMHEIKKYKIAKLEKQIEKLYVDTHDLYVELMEVRKIAEEASRKEEQSQLEASVVEGPGENGEGSERGELKVVKEAREKKRSCRSENDVYSIEAEKINVKIAKIKQTIQKRQEEYRNLVESEKTLVAQKIQFLKLLLKNGYHQTDGIWWILVKLAKNNEKLAPNDFYQILDQTTKQNLVAQYQLLKTTLLTSKKQPSTLPKIKQTQPTQKQKQSKSGYQSLQHITYSKLMSIPVEENAKKIYKETQEYIVDWVRKERWKVRSLKHKPSQGEGASVLQDRDWRHAEIRRLKGLYPKEKWEQMLKYIFGSAMYYEKGGQSLMQYFITTKRKESSHYEATPSRSVDQLTRNNTNK